MPVFQEIVDGIEYTITEQFPVSRLEVGQLHCLERGLFRFFRLCFRDDLRHDTVAFAELDGLACVDRRFDLSGDANL